MSEGRMRIKLLVFVVAIASSFPAFPSVNSGDIETIKEYIKYRVSDYRVVQYEFINTQQECFYKTVGVVKIGRKRCGKTTIAHINAKNMVGWYVGFRECRFIIEDEKVIFHDCRKLPEGL